MKEVTVIKRFLINIILGDYTPKETRDIVKGDEIGSLLNRQWNATPSLESTHKPDYRKLFEKIREKTHPEKAEKSIHTQFFIKEIENLRENHRLLKNRYRLWLSIAASLIFILCIASVVFLSTTRILKKTITESIAPSGQKSQLLLADGTKVYLNSGTILRYDSRFGKQNREIELAGEAYFEVMADKKLPFLIYTSDIEIKVMGTKFNVMAYPNEPHIETTVTEGTVNVKEINGEKSVILTANQKASYTRSNRQLVRDVVNPVTFTSWKENILYFDNENFENVINKLERWYGVSIHLEGKDSVDDRFTITIKNESLKEVLDLISLTTPLRYKIEENDVTISYKKK
ncbi:MAG: FecR family protein [Bacteroidales bacterium]|nr:FecR family protein [Bacteroidales bacterium]